MSQKQSGHLNELCSDPLGNLWMEAAQEKGLIPFQSISVGLILVAEIIYLKKKNPKQINERQCKTQ